MQRLTEEILEHSRSVSEGALLNAKGLLHLGQRAAVDQAHRAGIRIHVITGDYGPTAANIARQVGIGQQGSRIITGAALDLMGDAALDDVLSRKDEIVFARTSPEAKLRVCEALQGLG